MRCREAKTRLTGTRRNGIDASCDPAWQAHLKDCPDCARYALAARTLRQIFEAASEGDPFKITPLAVQRGRVERQADYSCRRAPGKMTALTAGIRLLRIKSQLGLGVAVAAAVLAVMLLVPFRYDRTIGYDIAFAGVNRELALDDDRICDMLHSLGLVEAAVDVLSCDTTCGLLIIDLKSKEEVELVVRAFNNMSAANLKTNVIPIVARTSGSILEHANVK